MTSFNSSYTKYQPLGVDTAFLDRIMKMPTQTFYDAEKEQLVNDYTEATVDKMKQETDLKGPAAQAKLDEQKQKKEAETLQTVREMSKIDPVFAKGMYDNSGLAAKYGEFNPKGEYKIVGSPSTGIARIDPEGAVSILQNPMARPKAPGSGEGKPAKFKAVEMRNDAGETKIVDGNDEQEIRQASAEGFRVKNKPLDLNDIINAGKPKTEASPSGSSMNPGSFLNGLFGGGSPASAQAPVQANDGTTLIVRRKKIPSVQPPMIPRAG